MFCGSCLRSVILQGGYIGRFTKGRVLLSNLGRSLSATWGQTDWTSRKFTKTVEMMVDTGATANRGPIVDVLPERDDDGGYASGGWKSEDGKLSCGYSSFRGKRASMEDFFDLKTAKIDGEMVCMFGIFDGHGGSRAAEFLQEHLFENLMKHPQFLSNTKLAISETYQQTDRDFLDSEKDTYRDDGSTASTAVLVGSHLYVANVGDSRTVISKAGTGIFQIIQGLSLVITHGVQQSFQVILGFSIYMFDVEAMVWFRIAFHFWRNVGKTDSMNVIAAMYGIAWRRFGGRTFKMYWVLEGS